MSILVDSFTLFDAHDIRGSDTEIFPALRSMTYRHTTIDTGHALTLL